MALPYFSVYVVEHPKIGQADALQEINCSDLQIN